MKEQKDCRALSCARMAAITVFLLILNFAVPTFCFAALKEPFPGFLLILAAAKKELWLFAFIIAALIIFDFTVLYIIFRRLSETHIAYAPETTTMLNPQSKPPRGCVMYIEIENWEEKSRVIPRKQQLALLAKFYALAANCVHKTEGIIENYFDANMFAVWNTGGADNGADNMERHLFQCLRCALLLRHEAYLYNKIQRNKALRIKINMGIHYGQIEPGLVEVNGMPELKLTGSLGTARKIASRVRNCNFDILISGYIYSMGLLYLVTECINTVDGSAYALVNIRNIYKQKCAHPCTVDEVRTIMNWSAV
ncbi:MAG: hypothetical protein LBG72_00575 [Spirochaetaceae bacterium]|jgi:hypothetical protein|nr:hypothetical protein [Spirochaetaceae bacterium]